MALEALIHRNLHKSMRAKFNFHRYRGLSEFPLLPLIELLIMQSRLLNETDKSICDEVFFYFSKFTHQSPRMFVTADISRIEGLSMPSFFGNTSR